MEQMYSCPNCGEIVYYGEPVCRNCGIDLDWSAVEVSPPQDEYQYQDYGQEQQPDQQQWDQQQWEQQSEENRQAGYGQYYPPPVQRTRLTRPRKPGQKKSFGDYIAVLRKRKKLISIVVISVLCIAIAGTAIALGIGVNPFATTDNGQSDNAAQSADNTTPIPVVSGPVDITKFIADPPVIPMGNTCILYWEVSGATQVSIDQGIGPVPPSGQQVISPEATTTYTLTASNDSGSVNDSVTISVSISAPVVNFTATPATIGKGGTSVLKWEVKGATKINIQGIGSVSASGTKEVSPESTTTYTLAASNSAGVTNASATVSIGASGEPVITAFTATPDFINTGGSSNLEWYVTNANSVSINQTIGTVGTYGSKSVTPESTTTYTLTATNSIGSSTLSVTVTISSDGKPVISRFSASPTHITTGQNSTLQWAVAGAETIFIDPGIGAVSATGTKVVTPNATTSYTLSATNSKGTTTATATVNFSTVNLPVIENFTVSPSTIFQGGSATLSWSTTNANTINIDNGVGSVSASGTHPVSPLETTIYTITATNESGDVTNEITVSVY